MGRLFENAVFLELKRRKPPQEEIHYWRNQEGIEADFVVREGLKAKGIIQVVYAIENEKTKEREIRGLVTCVKDLGLKEGMIITNNLEGTEKIDNITIQFIPLWKWFLRDDNL